jgi:protein-arginine kinase
MCSSVFKGTMIMRKVCQSFDISPGGMSIHDLLQEILQRKIRLDEYIPVVIHFSQTLYLEKKGQVTQSCQNIGCTIRYSVSNFIHQPCILFFLVTYLMFKNVTYCTLKDNSILFVVQISTQ